MSVGSYNVFDIEFVQEREVASAMAKSPLQQAGSLFGFLKDLLRLRNKPVKTISQYANAGGHWVHHLDETPATKNGIAFWGSLGLRALNALAGDLTSTIQLGITTFKETKGSILRLPKVTTPEPPQPSDKLGPWIDGDLDDVFETPKLFEILEISDSSDEQITSSLRLEDHPAIQREFSNWLKDWLAWADKVKVDLELQRLYTSLFEARDQIRDQSQDWEFILGIGRLRLGIGTDKEIDRHIFTIPCVIDLDSTTGVLFVRLDEEYSFRVEDDWIQGFKKPEMADLEEVLQVLNTVTELTDEAIKKELIKLAHKFRADIVTDIDPADFKKRDSLVLAPSLILRKRGKQDLIKLLEKLENSFATATELPAPLMSLLEPGYGERTSNSDWSGDGAVIVKDQSAYLPLSLNSKQMRALETADTRNATIIQGPPGTGKTRTIAVMISHFLAKGQRVLVAAQTPQALREVRSQLPDEIKDLAVASLGSSKSDNDDLQKAVNALVDAYENRHELYDNFDKYESDLNAKIEKLHSERALTIRSIIDLRSQETEQLNIEGLTGSRAHLAWVHLQQRHEFDWLKSVSDENLKAPEFEAAQADSIATDLRRIWESAIRVPTTLKLPGIQELWTEEQFNRAQRLKALLEKPADKLNLVPDFALELSRIIEPGLEMEIYLKQSSSNWTKVAVKEAISYGEKPFFIRIQNALGTLSDLDDLLKAVGPINEIENTETALDWLPILDAISERISKKGDLKTSVTGSVKKSLLSGSAIKNAEPILNKVKILGKSPNSVSDVEKVKALVRLDHLTKTLLIDLGIDSNELPAQRYDRTIWLQEQKKLLNKAIEFEKVTSEVRAYLNRKLPKTSEILTENLQLEDLYDSSLSINAAADLKNYERELNAHIAKVQNAVAGTELPYITSYINSLKGSNANDFSQARTVLETHIVQQNLSKELIARVQEIVGLDQVFINKVTEWVDSDLSPETEREVLDKIRNLVSAFKWKRLGDALGGASTEEYGVLFRTVNRCDEQIENHVREIAKRRSWKKALERIDANTLSQMQRYALESRKFGAGTGITAARRIREIRKLLNECVPAIPAWIMPIDQVAQRFTAELEMFDVIIIDEASQARLDAIFLLALSKRIVIVGDHKQVSPERGMIADAEVQQLVQRHLAGDSRQANWGNADLSLFDECKAAFGNMITLTEHRRCVPEIIGFSNQIAYIPENIRLVPVRQTGSDALPPIKTIFVPNGYVHLSGNQPQNPPEAEVISKEVARMVNDPAYRGMTIGVVTLQGSKQQDLIREKLIHSVDPAEWEARQIRVGTPPDFQGSERNVILLSMVMAPNGRSTAQTRETMVQRYNVAASRAKDQLILVHSVRSADLKNTNDLRKQLIDYCQNVESGLRNPIEGAVGLVPNDELVDPFDSLFEQRVHNEIVSRGYKVIPQFEPQIEGYGYRIDLVVVGPHGKFAIECDGDFWHGEEEFEKDFIRQENLERCGWKFFRIRESRFYSDPNSLEELWPQLDKFVTAQNVVPDSASSPSTKAEVEISPEEFDVHSEVLITEADEELLKNDFNPDSLDYTAVTQSAPKEIYVDGLRVREFPKPISPEYQWLQPYRSWDPEESRRFTKVDSSDRKILEELLEIVKIEGPMLGSYLMRRHYKATGGSSLSSNKETLYLKQIKSVMNRGEFVMEEQVAGETIASATFRTHEQAPVITRVRGARDLYDMPPREIAMIIRGVMKTHKDLGKASNREMLFRQVLLLLDFTKLTKKAEDHLTRIFATYAEEITAK